MRIKSIELLAPAGNTDIGKAAINYGADAVYIGAHRFSARKAAGNTLKEIESLIRYAHSFNAKVYIALNTIIKDNELEEAREIIEEIYQAGADALIIQDMGLLEMNLPPIPLFASTQTNNVTWQKVEFLEKVGFQRIILARELSMDEIKEIKNKTTVDLEFFVHGSLCVSYSGQCYFSHALNGRSGNRGECAQPCRMPYSLVDKNDNAIIKDKYLLSLKDINLSHHLRGLMDAGITSFKIEGRLKDINYVRNITAYYRQELDRVMNKDSEIKSSTGKTIYHFTADPERSFNRGFTNYFVEGRQKNIFSPESPKSLGKQIGTIQKTGSDYFVAKLTEPLVNGDGICFYDHHNVLHGIRVNKVDGNKIFPHIMAFIPLGATIYRNADLQFTRLLETDKTKRSIHVSLILTETTEGIALLATDEDGVTVENSISIEKQEANKKEEALQSLREALAKTGNTLFEAKIIDIRLDKILFIPSSIINSLRRTTLEMLEEKRIALYQRNEFAITPTDFPYPEKELSYFGNVINKKAEEFYFRHGVTQIEPAFETQLHYAGKTLMTTKHCLLNELGMCKKTSKSDLVEPLYIIDKNNKFKVEFDCARCVMRVLL